MESAQAKNQALRDAGAIVPTSYEALESAIKETFEKLVSLSDILYCTLIISYIFFHCKTQKLLIHNLYSCFWFSLMMERLHQ